MGEYKFTVLFLSSHVQFKLINHTVSHIYPFSSHKGQGQKPFVRFSLLAHEPEQSPFVRTGLHTLDPQPWEADLTHITHSQLRGLVEIDYECS